MVQGWCQRAMSRRLACRLGRCLSLSAVGSAEGAPTGHTERHEVRQRDLPEEGGGEFTGCEDGPLVDGDEDGSHDEGRACRAPQERPVAGGAAEAVVSTAEVVGAAEGEAAAAAGTPLGGSSRAHRGPRSRPANGDGSSCGVLFLVQVAGIEWPERAYSPVSASLWALCSRVHTSRARAKSVIACGPATANPRSNAAGSLQR